MIRNLAQQIVSGRSGAHPGTTSTGSNVVSGQVSPENGVPALIEIEDLKQKVTRLIEQVDQHD